MRLTRAPAIGVIPGDAAGDPALAPVEATSDCGGSREEHWPQTGHLWRVSSGQHLAQSPKYFRPGFEEETEELGGPAARDYEV